MGYKLGQIFHLAMRKDTKKAHESGIGENEEVKAEVMQLHNIYSLRLC